jgi:hypothetical protein
MPVPPNVDISPKRARAYRAVGIGLVLWTAGYIFLLAKVVPTAIYWLSYYAVDYESGFVRRGLAGTVVDFFGPENHFTVAYTLMWASFGLYCAALVLLMWHIRSRGNPSERRVVVTLLIPVLPFAVTFAIFGPRPELFAAAALIAFAILLSRRPNPRAAVLASVLYGGVITILAFVHEAIPIEFALGATLALSVLAPTLTTRLRALCLSLAAAPGLIATAIVATLGRRDVAPQLCQQVPEAMIDNALQVPPERLLDYALGRYESVADYQDWVCEHVIPYFSVSMSAGVQSVLNLGVGSLLAGFVHGLVVCLGTLWLIQYFTGVRWREFVGSIRSKPVIPLLALCLMVPIFATGVDWIRWWTIILINVAVVYLTFAADRQGIEKPVSGRTFRAFAVVLILLACLPLSAGPGYFTGWVTV